MRHSNDVLQARANVNKYKDVYGIVHKAFASRDTENVGQSPAPVTKGQIAIARPIRPLGP